MPHCLHNSIFSTFCFTIENLASQQRRNLASHQKTIWQSNFDAILRRKRHNKDIIVRAERYHIEIHNVTSHIGGGWVVVNLTQSLMGGGWVPKNVKIRVTYYVNSPLK